MTYQFKIQIQGISKPPVWREITVPSDFTFLRFHNVIQAAFDWEDCHLFEFRDKEYESKIRISISPEEDDFFDPKFSVEAQDASKVRLSDIFTDKVRKLVYVYDFGDNWVHEITLESVKDIKTKKAVCLSGKGACPPENCGGRYGYEEIKKIFATMPESEAANEYREWLGIDEGEVWDAGFFDRNEINIYLEEV